MLLLRLLCLWLRQLLLLCILTAIMLELIVFKTLDEELIALLLHERTIRTRVTVVVVLHEITHLPRGAYGVTRYTSSTRETRGVAPRS